MSNKIFSEQIEGFYHYYPTTVAVVTVKSGERDNLMSAAWHTPLSSKPPLFGVAMAHKRYTFELIREAKEFAVNFMPFSAAETIAQAGAVSGRDVDKFKQFNFAAEPGKKIKSPILNDAYAAYECKLFEHKTFGDHVLVVGEIVAAHQLDNGYAPEGLPRIEQLKPAVYIGKDHYLEIEKYNTIHLDRKAYK
ncbi:MAG: flavin reductase family protein [Candidatus Margulisiibacteriota bacterium]